MMRISKYLAESFILILAMITCANPSLAQSLSLYRCYQLADSLSPLKKKELLYETILTLDQQAKNSGNLPYLTLNGQASYQSEVFNIPVQTPGQEIPIIPKDQYNFSINIRQKIYDGGIVSSNKSKSEIEALIRQSELKVSLYETHGVINELFFGIIQISDSKKTLQALNEELDNQLKRAQTSFENGVILKSAVLSFQMEKLKASQELEVMEIKEKALLELLEDWIGLSVPSTENLVSPTVDKEETASIERPEIAMFDHRKALFSNNEEMLAASSRPKLMGFANAGMGSPNPLNIFETDLQPYWMLGAKIEWNINTWGDVKKQREIMSVNQHILDAEKENFIKNIDRQSIQIRSQMQELESLVRTDLEILELQMQILEEAESQYNLGVMTSTDYITELNEKTRAELKLNLDRTRLNKLKIDLKTLRGI